MTYRVRNLVLAIGLALLGILMVTIYVSQVKRSVSKDKEDVTVYVAKDDVSAGTPGTEVQRLLVATTVARRNVVPGAISNPGEIAGRYTTQEIFQGEQVTTRPFSTTIGSGVRAEISGNQRVIELDASPQQLLAGTLKDGDHVDVVATWELPEGDQHHVSRVLLRNLLVVQAPDASSVKTSVTNPASGGATIQLRVTDLQAHELFWMTENGHWSLLLRPPVHAGDSPDNLLDSETIGAGGVSHSAYLKASGGNK
ncbi:MAG: Flp pilus assembly protein CpaB [Gaiellaceae bacterium]